MHVESISRPANAFQRPLTSYQIEQVCREAFGIGVQVKQARELGVGQFNTTYRIDLDDENAVILRVAPDTAVSVFTHEQNLLQREYNIAPYLSGVSNLVPRILFADFSHRLIDRDYVFQNFLSGEVWHEIQAELTPAENDALWQELAIITRIIHGTTSNTFGFPPPELSFLHWSEALIHIISGMRADMAALRLDTNGTGPFMQALVNGRHWLDEITTPHLLHGDLWPQNVLVDRQSGSPRIVGLLDAERGLWGDPMAEWIFHLLDIPDAFWQTYQQVPTGPGAQFRQLAYRGMYTLQIILEAARFNWDSQPLYNKLAIITKEMQLHGHRYQEAD